MWWTSTTGVIELKMTAEQAASVNHQGQCDDDVLALSKIPAIVKQIEKIDKKTIVEVLDEFGTWSDEELKDHEQNIQRLLWIAACDIDDSAV